MGEESEERSREEKAMIRRCTVFFSYARLKRLCRHAASV